VVKTAVDVVELGLLNTGQVVKGGDQGSTRTRTASRNVALLRIAEL
jgi:hypothetical protein